MGPVPAVDAERLWEVRAQYLAASGWAERGEAAESMRQRDRRLLDHRGDYLLWFEADLYDQLQLVQILDLLRGAGVEPARITLVCIGEYPGIGHFGGLGELSAGQLAGLRSSAAVLSATSMDLASRAWAALRAPEPGGYPEIVATVSSELRFVPESFDRLGREFPSTRDGLSLTERRVLAALADGPRTAVEVFGQVAAREIRPFLGDTACFLRIEELGGGDRPLLSIADGVVELTADGHRVLDGEADRIDLIGIDRWIGGVHLSAGTPLWRWHEGTERLVRR